MGISGWQISAMQEQSGGGRYIQNFALMDTRNKSEHDGLLGA
jgi:hypothetical protein